MLKKTKQSQKIPKTTRLRKDNPPLQFNGTVSDNPQNFSQTQYLSNPLTQQPAQSVIMNELDQSGSKSSTTQLDALNLALPIHNKAQSGDFDSQATFIDQQTNDVEFLTLKEISNDLDTKLNNMQTQLNDIVDNTGLPSPLMLESLDTPNIVPPEANHEQSIAPQSLKTSAIIKHTRGNSLAQDSETQTELGEAASHQLQKIHDQKFQIFQLKERLKELEGKNRYDQVMTNEKIRT